MNKKSLGIALLSLSVMTFAACSSSDDDDNSDADAGTVDAGTVDAGAADAGAADAGAADAGAADAGAADAGAADAGAADAGAADAGAADAGAADAGAADAGTADGGAADGGDGGGSGDPIGDAVTELLNANGASAALGLLQMQGLVQNIGTSDWTLFLPSDEAAAAFTGDINVFAHIYDVTALSAEALTGMVGGDLMLNSNGGSPVVAIAGGGTEPLTVGGHTVTTADLSIDGGTAIIHIIDGVIPAAL